MTDERQGKNKGIAISSFDANAEKQSRQAIDRKVLNSQKIISWGMNFNYLLPGGGKGSRIFGEDHMVFRGTRGGQSSLTEYEGGGRQVNFLTQKNFPRSSSTMQSSAVFFTYWACKISVRIHFTLVRLDLRSLWHTASVNGMCRQKFLIKFDSSVMPSVI